MYESSIYIWHDEGEDDPEPGRGLERSHVALLRGLWEYTADRRGSSVGFRLFFIERTLETPVMSNVKKYSSISRRVIPPLALLQRTFGLTKTC